MKFDRPFVVSIAVALVVAFGLRTPVSFAQDSPPASALDRAVESYSFEQYDEALALLKSIDAGALSAGEKEQLEEYLTLAETGLRRQNTAVSDFNRARQALRDGKLEEARQLNEAVLDNVFAPVDLHISATARLAKIKLLERKKVKHPLVKKNVSQPVKPVKPGQAAPPNVPPADRIAAAKDRIRQGWAALRNREYQQAQDHFSVARWYVPDAPLEKVYVDTHTGLAYHRPPRNDERHRVRVITGPSYHVTMNLQLGISRLIASETFQFTGGVGVDGFVQLPNISRTQFKSTVTVPASPVGGRKIVILQDYYILIKPKL